MRIGVLTIGSEQDGDNRIVEAAQRRGCEIQLINYLDCSLMASCEEPKIFYHGEDITNKFDVIIPRVDTPHTTQGLTILKQFEAVGVPCTDNARSIAKGHDKLRSAQCLIQEKVPTPTTGFALSTEDHDKIIENIGGFPVIIKLAEGTEGVGVFLAKDAKEAKNILGTLSGLKARVIIQEFIGESAGCDIRSFVVGGQIVANMRRQSQDKDFRANVAQGAKSYNEELSAEEEKVVMAAVKSMELNIAGIDLIRSTRGALVIEVNTSPFFTGEFGIESVTGVDVAGHMVDFAIKCAKGHRFALGGVGNIIDFISARFDRHVSSKVA